MHSHILYTLLLWSATAHSYCCISNNSKCIKDFYRAKRETELDLRDADLNFTQLATKYGYIAEQHSTTTEDGYILNMHRLPPRNNVAKRNIAVFLMHGVLDSSDGWILLGPKYALGYILSDGGFDVWMGNARGNKYSSNHTSLTTNNSEYWQFSWDEIGLYDLPAMIDYTLNVTGNDRLYYIGHSQGTTAFYVMSSLRPEYNSRVAMMFSLAPVSWMSHARSLVFKLLSPAYGIFSYLPSNSLVDYYNVLSNFYCKYFTASCESLIQLIIGRNYKYMDTSFLKVIFAHGSSSAERQLLHYGQLHKSGKFRRYDYGEVENLRKYHNRVPPDYEVGGINVPIVLFYSDNDYLSDTIDVDTLKRSLPHVVKVYHFDKFNHFDYMYAKIAKELVYMKIINEIKDNESTRQV